MEEAVVKAYAKINLILDVKGKRADGFHEVEMIMQNISLHDQVIIRPGQGISIGCNHPSVPKDEKNLAYKAAEILLKKHPQLTGVEIFIEKNIPMEAGLAGGSTDAAAVILGMDKLFALNMEREEMHALGAQLGSDVPFCLAGPTAYAYGRGEKLIDIPDCPPLTVVLVKPPFGVKTKEVYQNLKLHQTDNSIIKKYIEAIRTNDVEFILKNLSNTLENSTFSLYPEVKTIKEKIINLGADYVLMSGSGSAIFALFPYKANALETVWKLEKYFEEVYIAHTLNNLDIKERVKIR
ncbi:MAG: 4-(cytidine 5'-diphospho)-2-C-methyl-D-erythritol kinase [Bacillota bacterium]